MRSVIANPVSLFYPASRFVHMQTVPVARVRGNHHDHKSCHRVMINDRVIRGPNVIRFDRYTYLGKVDRVVLDWYGCLRQELDRRFGTLPDSPHRYQHLEETSRCVIFCNWK